MDKQFEGMDYPGKSGGATVDYGLCLRDPLMEHAATLAKIKADVVE